MAFCNTHWGMLVAAVDSAGLREPKSVCHPYNAWHSLAELARTKTTYENLNPYTLVHFVVVDELVRVGGLVTYFASGCAVCSSDTAHDSECNIRECRFPGYAAFFPIAAAQVKVIVQELQAEVPTVKPGTP